MSNQFGHNRDRQRVAMSIAKNNSDKHANSIHKWFDYQCKQISSLEKNRQRNTRRDRTGTHTAHISTLGEM